MATIRKRKYSSVYHQKRAEYVKDGDDDEIAKDFQQTHVWSHFPYTPPRKDTFWKLFYKTYTFNIVVRFI
jgi:hypothetical protein